MEGGDGLPPIDETETNNPACERLQYRKKSAMIFLFSSLLLLIPESCVAWIQAPRHAQSHYNHHLQSIRRNLHSAVVSPFATSSPNHRDNETFTADPFCKDSDNHDTQLFAELCELLDASPTDLLRFDSRNADGVRGVYLNREVKAGDILLSIPLQSCLIDQQPPEWLTADASENPDKWATRLAASWIDLYLKQNHDRNDAEKSLHAGIKLWMSLLPDPDFLRASLPVHWPEETVQNARCTSLEIAVDTAYFSRAEAVQDLVESLESHENFNDELHSVDAIHNIANRALDLVQTRSCRLYLEGTNDNDDDDGSDSVCRVLAPGFDFINHGARCDDTRFLDDGCANASFQVETVDGKECLIVRALKDLKANDPSANEILIDYGSSARPAWRCLQVS